jgi:hypothetical protein
MDMSQSFGDPKRYYARPSHIGSQTTSSAIIDSTEEMIRDLLVQRHHDLRERVEYTCKRQNQIIRELLNKHTALRLSVGNSRQQVSVRVVDGLPEPLAHVVETIPQREIWELILNRSLLQSTVAGLDFTDQRLNAIAAWQPIHDAIELGTALRQSREFISWLTETLERTEILDRIARIDQDVLGAYFLQNQPPTIQIYWMAIGIFSSLQDISVESLTVVTLAHELAHAFTHIGYDTDRQQWDTRAFSKTDPRIAEGLAQFYTEIVCQEFDEKNFGAGCSEAFNKLLRQQQSPYTCFRNWVGNATKRQEIIRSCLIQCRTDQLTDYHNFEASLQEAAQRIDRKTKSRMLHIR